MIEVISLSSAISYASNSYLICSGNECAVIDPSVPYSSGVLRGNKLRYIILTHGHFDHFLGIDSWVESTGATVLVSNRDKNALSDPVRNCYRMFLGTDSGYFGDCVALEHDDSLSIGDDLISVMACPGHTPGSITLVVDGAAFVGDTVFAGGAYGRYDLPGGDVSSLADSIKKICKLLDDTVVYPGHGEVTSIKEIKKHFCL